MGVGIVAACASSMHLEKTRWKGRRKRNSSGPSHFTQPMRSMWRKNRLEALYVMHVHLTQQSCVTIQRKVRQRGQEEVLAEDELLDGPALVRRVINENVEKTAMRGMVSGTFSEFSGSK